MTYEIVRFYQGDHPQEVIATGLSLEDAKAHCNDPETSSRTATGAEAVARTEEHGPWFDGFRAEATDTEPCDECGAEIPADAPDMVNDAHDPSCSLYPTAGE